MAATFELGHLFVDTTTGVYRLWAYNEDLAQWDPVGMIVDNDVAYRAVNNAGSSLIDLLKLNTSDQIELCSATTISAGNLTVSDGKIDITESAATPLLTAHSDSASLATSLVYVTADTTAAPTWNFFRGDSDIDGTSDIEYRLRGDGTGLASIAWTAPGADYAEYMEWADGNPSDESRWGIAVTIVPTDSGKVLIKEAEEGDDVYGVTSPNPSVIGNNDWNGWIGKNQRDKYGVVQRDERGARIRSDEYDESKEHIAREFRQEWVTVGLTGIVLIRDGQLTDPRWGNFGSVGDGLSRWLLR